jgi:hypothetical protein
MLGDAELASNDGILAHRDELNVDDGPSRGLDWLPASLRLGDGG